MSSYETLTSANFDSNANLDALHCGDHGTFHKMLKYWRHSSSKAALGLKKSSAFLESPTSEEKYSVGGVRGGGGCNVSYKRLESFEEKTFKKMVEVDVYWDDFLRTQNYTEDDTTPKPDGQI